RSLELLLAPSSAGSTLMLGARPPNTSCTIRFPSSISPLEAPQAIHFHMPSSDRDFVPGGAWPLTSRQREQSRTILFLAAVSSSPSSVSRIRSYQCDSGGEDMAAGGNCVKAVGGLPSKAF